MRLKLEEVNLAPLLAEVIDLYHYVAEEKQITVTASYPPELSVTADAARLRQALANLLDNAVKIHSGRGQDRSYRVRPGDQKIVAFKDTGEGIAPEELAKIWDRLYRSDKSRTQRGLGLGLSLVRAIIRAHGGRVEVASEVGSGSLFTVYLPA